MGTNSLTLSSKQHIAIVGTPNAGKTTLLNALTGCAKPVGHWAGVTVEPNAGGWTHAGVDYQCLDLPGFYCLDAPMDSCSLDERFSLQTLEKTDWNLIVQVIDPNAWTQGVYLTSQLLELGKPLVVVFNQRDNKQDTACMERYAKRWGVPVFQWVLHETGVQKSWRKELVSVIQNVATPTPPDFSSQEHWAQACSEVSFEQNTQRTFMRALLQKKSEKAWDIEVAEWRYQWALSFPKPDTQETMPDASRLDRWALHRVWALPIFLMIMYVFFFCTMRLGGLLQAPLDVFTEGLLVKGMAALLQSWHWPAWGIAVLAGGVGQGVSTALSFVPLIGCLFFFLSALEQTGYLARAALMTDRLMQKLGLPGQAFIPMIVGFGCNVPGILSARTLKTHPDRVTTILMLPFMSCSARLTVYAVIAGAFFQSQAPLVMFALYVTGILIAVGVGFLVRKRYFEGQRSALTLVLPHYQWPSLTVVLQQTKRRLWLFFKRTTRIILPLCFVLGVLARLTLQGGWVSDAQVDASLLALLAKGLTPLFAPMGVTQHNWPATVGLVTGGLAKEIVVATLNTLYTQMAHAGLWLQHTFSFKETFQDASAAFQAYWQAHFSWHTVAEPSGMQSVARGMMTRLFETKSAAFAYLLFVALYVPCVSTVAAIARELSWRWAMRSVLWCLMLAYGVSVLFYQLAMFSINPLVSLLWVLSIGAGLVCWVRRAWQ